MINFTTNNITFFKSVLILANFALFAEYFIVLSAVYLTIMFTILTYTIWRLNMQKALSETISIVLLMACYLIINDDVIVLQTLTLNGSVINDSLSFFSKLFICFFSAIYFFLIADSLNAQKLVGFEYLIILLFAVLGLMLLCSSHDLLTSYISIELTSLASYIVAGYRKDSSYSVEAGLKYFIAGSVSSAFFLLGSSYIYACSGTIKFSDLWLLFSDKFVFYPVYGDVLEFSEHVINKYCGVIDYYSEAWKDLNSNQGQLMLQKWAWEYYYGPGWQEEIAKQLLWFWEGVDTVEIPNKYVFSTGFDKNEFKLVQYGMILVLFSVFIKLALAPFHLWSLDVYEGSPTSSSFFFAALTKLSLFIFLIRFCYVAMNGFSNEWQFYSICVASISVLVGSLGGLKQRKLKTLLAYSSVSHMGYALLAFSTSSLFGVQIVLFYIIVYIFSNVCVWYILTLLRIRTTNSKTRNIKFSKELSDLALLGKSNPALAFSLSIAMFSIAGLPPLVGFIAKLGIFLSLLKENFYFVAVLAMICSVISTFYYIRIIKVLYFENTLVGRLYYPIHSRKVWILSFLTFGLFYLFLNPGLLFLIIQNVVLESLVFTVASFKD